MTSERMKRRLEALLDEADAAVTADEWQLVASKARAALAIDDANADARTFLAMAVANGVDVPGGVPLSTDSSAPMEAPGSPSVAPAQPESFAGGRYRVLKFLGEGGRKRVFLAHDALLDRDVAFALIKTDGLDDVGRERIVREAQAMGRMGAHPHIVSVFDLGEEQGAPYIVTELMGGGDVEGEVEHAAGPLALPRALEIATGVARGLAFAHERGIVHRDLKPGNVWLTADGVAKIGDFGLAVAEGRSRLTQHGMMVGTFDYMPPEQALGHEATAQSDLYSLGAMLYELVTGKPPFQGDTPTAVISQHLNAQPVAPSWHTEHCPPDLEALILRLLAKVPADRPSSAVEVLEALDRVDPNARSVSHSDSQANPLDRLAHGVFVGRERELERLRTSLDNALQGHGSVVMLVGEPGIGKTRTTQELETYARMRGAKVLWGRAHESGGAPPYWPWVQVARAYREETPDTEQRRRQYEPYAVELQRIFPALKDLFPNLPAPPADTEEGQFRLFDAFAGFARGVAAETPLVFVLDDLHWADRATLQLLTHLARELSRARILVVGTYRDTDLDRRHPLAQALADLNREDLFTRIPLRGLSLEETADYVRRASSVDLPRELTARIYEETEGNPFFLSEVVNLMTQEGTLTATARDVQIPEGVRQALGRRLDRLSADANALLTTLAVAGRDFDHALVSALSSHDDATTLALVEEALRARVLQENGVGRYRFTHALMQETLRDELSAARRVLLHGQLAEVCERLYGEARDTLATIADHYRESAVLNPVHAAQAARYLRLAAESEASALAHEDAARHYEQCLALVQAAPDRLGEDEADLHAALAASWAMGGNATGSWNEMHRAIDVDRDPVASARRLLAFRLRVGASQWSAQRALVREVMGRIEPYESTEAAEVLALYAALDVSPLGDAVYERAAALAQKLGLSGTAYPLDLHVRRAIRTRADGDLAGGLRVLREALPEYRDAGILSYPAIAMLISLSAAEGDLGVYADALAAGAAYARATGSRMLTGFVSACEAALLWKRGRHQEARALAVSVAEQVNFGQLLLAGFDLEDGALNAALARCAEADDWQLADAGLALARARALRAQALLLLGSRSDAARAYTAWRDEYYIPTRGLFAFEVSRFELGDAVRELATKDDLATLAADLASTPTLRLTFWGALPTYFGGVIALQRGRIDEAEQHFRTGLEWCERPDVRFEVDAGRCLQGLAEVAERRGQHLEAMQHLDAAGELFARHGAKLYLDQVIAKKQILKA